jgi:hypothetical protein
MQNTIKYAGSKGLIRLTLTNDEDTYAFERAWTNSVDEVLNDISYRAAEMVAAVCVAAPQSGSPPESHLFWFASCLAECFPGDARVEEMRIAVDTLWRKYRQEDKIATGE